MSPNININELYKKFNSLDAEIRLNLRKREEESKKIETALNNISSEAVELLLPIVPDIAVIKSYTASEIAENKNNEIEKIKNVYDKLSSYISERLDYYEAELD